MQTRVSALKQCMKIDQNFVFTFNISTCLHVRNGIARINVYSDNIRHISQNLLNARQNVSSIFRWFQYIRLEKQIQTHIATKTTNNWNFYLIFLVIFIRMQFWMFHSTFQRYVLFGFIHLFATIYFLQQCVRRFCWSIRDVHNRTFDSDIHFYTAATPDTSRIQSKNTETRTNPSGTPAAQCRVHEAMPTNCPFAANGLPKSYSHKPWNLRAKAQSVALLIIANCGGRCCLRHSSFVIVVWRKNCMCVGKGL